MNIRITKCPKPGNQAVVGASLRDDGRKPSEVGYKRSPRPVEEDSDIKMSVKSKAGIKGKVMGSQKKEGEPSLWSDFI